MIAREGIFQSSTTFSQRRARGLCESGFRVIGRRFVDGLKIFEHGDLSVVIRDWIVESEARRRGEEKPNLCE